MDTESRTPTTLAAAVSAIDARGEAAAPTLAAAAPADLAPRTGRFVQCTVDGTCYAVSQAFVTELDRVPPITIVPRAPSWLRGVTNLRGDVLSVVDVRLFLGLDATSSHTGRMLVVRLLDEDLSMGLLVDAITQIVTLELDAIRPPTARLEGPLAPYLTGMCVVGERLVAVLDLERWLHSTELRQYDEGQEEATCEAR